MTTRTSQPDRSLFERTRPLSHVLDHDIRVQLEGLNSAGSIKLRPALSMVADAEARGVLTCDTVLIEASSGNLGVALATIAAHKGLQFVCVIDPRCNRLAAAKMRAVGATLATVTEPDPVGGFLRARRERVRSLCASDERYLWLNQHENAANSMAHYTGTASELLAANPDLDVLFLGVGTGGTAMGCARYVREHRPEVRIVGIDVIGSVTFDTLSDVRLIPGLGAGVTTKIFDAALLDDMIHVSETDTIRMCRTLATRGMLLGGSTGSILAGAVQWLDAFDRDHALVAATVAPDMGDGYLDTVYDDDWVLAHYPPVALLPFTPEHPAMDDLCLIRSNDPISAPTSHR